jgi:hypothetical protein
MAPETSTTDQSLKDSSSYRSPYPTGRAVAANIFLDHGKIVAEGKMPRPDDGKVADNGVFSRVVRQGSAASATQCRSNPVSGRGLPKTGICLISARDYRLFRSGTGQTRRVETGR